ncbi:MAG: AI-2E family transporter [Ruminococcus sp.]|nr:AI-2E family transporter [Ruminococcus sp.]
MKQKRNNPFVSAGLTAIAVIAAAMVMIYIVFQRSELASIIQSILDILQPFLIGGVLAYLLAPLCNKFENMFIRLLPDKPKSKKWAFGLSITLSSLTALLIFAIVVMLIVPATIDSLVSIVKAVPDYIVNFIAWANEKLEAYPDVKRYMMNAVDVVYERLEDLTADLTTSMQTIQPMLSGVGSGIGVILQFLLNVVIGFIISIYFLISRRTFARQGKMLIYALFPSKTADMVYDEILYADKMFSGFLRGKVLDSMIIGIICFVVLSIMNYQDAVLISVIVGVTNIIPFFGPFIGAIPSALLILVIEPRKVIWFIIFILVLQQIDGNIIGPRCMGSTTKMSAFWILFAILFFGGIMGVVGMIIGVPLFAVIYDIVKKFVYNRLEKHGKTSLMPAKATDSGGAAADDNDEADEYKEEASDKPDGQENDGQSDSQSKGVKLLKKLFAVKK